MILTLETAEKMLLGPDGQAFRARQGARTASEPFENAGEEAIAQAVDRVVAAGGTKSQERMGTVVCRRATCFFNGVEYLVEESVHKKYDQALDAKRCCVLQGDLVLFEWVREGPEEVGRASIRRYIRGPWITDLLALAGKSHGTC